ncbi:MAG TPA: ABC transporter ATP-binding protein [Feifaniaceae bacterium]|nr:ABC transporter ATP-binding protein [Feifaniaceae bacterium]
MDELLRVRGLKTYYYSAKHVIPAVDGVSFSLRQGEVLGLVGESGSGKSTVARSVTRIFNKAYTRIEAGEILFHGRDLLKVPDKKMFGIRGRHISMVFQNPQTSLNPVFSVGNQLEEAILLHEKMPRALAREKAVELLRQVNIPSPGLRMGDFPHQLSGGMQQRVMIAIALACRPELIIADEPTTALDVTIQAQILDLFTRLRGEYGMSMLLITHNMGVVAEICDRMMVMYGGVVMEEGRCADVFAKPLHEYTKGLLACIPNLDEDKDLLYSIPGQAPRLEAPVRACRFSDRCGKAFGKCREQEPPLIALTGARAVRCWLYGGKEAAG